MNKFFETKFQTVVSGLSNHLGNVLTTISDRKTPNNTTIGATVTYYKPVIITANDYYPFGMLMPGRNYNDASNKDYRYGFNGKKNDNDIKGIEGGQQDYGMRIYDPRLGRFLSVDPLMKNFAMLTPYQFASNTPIIAIDLDGEESKIVHTIMYYNSARELVTNTTHIEILDKAGELGSGTLYTTRFFHVLPTRMSVSGTDLMPIAAQYSGDLQINFYVPPKLNFVQRVGKWIARKLPRINMPGFVVFGSCTSGDCYTGKGKAAGRELFYINLNDPETKEFFQLLDIYSKSAAREPHMPETPFELSEKLREKLFKVAKIEWENKLKEKEQNVHSPSNSEANTKTGVINNSESSAQKP